MKIIMAEYSSTNGYVFDAQVNYGWGLSLNMTGKAPEVSKRIFDTYEHMLYYVNDYNDSCIPGLALKVMADSDETKNGVYFVIAIGTEGADKSFANDGEVVKLATVDNLGDTSSDLSDAIEEAINNMNVSAITEEGKAIVSVSQQNGKLVAETGDIAASHVTVASDSFTESTVEDVLVALDGRLDAIEGDKTFVKAVNVNGVDATIADNKAIVTIDGSDVKLSTEYIAVEYPSQVQDKFTSVVGEATVDAAIKQVETNLSQLVQEVLDNEEVTAAAFTEIKESVGLDENLKYVANAESTYIKDATSFAEADSLLDAAIKNEVDSLNEKIDNVSNAAISIKEGEGISISENGTEKTISAVEKENDSLIEVTENGIGIKDAGYIDCGKF